jgi:aminoglycoside/choline kinase family phosphotransferase
VGAVVLARPTLLATSLGVDAITAERTAWIARFFAGRDLALGVGAVAGSRGCQLAACASDASDFVAVAAAFRAGHVRPAPAILAAATAAGAAVAGAAALFVTRN